MNAEYAIALQRVSRSYGTKKVLDDITLAFLKGARIGVIGPNGSGKSSLLKVLAGEDTEFEGMRQVGDGIRIGYVPQEPKLTPGTVNDNLAEAVAETRDLLKRFDALNEKLAEPLDAEAMQAVLDDLEKVQTEIDHRGAWELERKLEQAGQALGLPPGDADVSKCSGGERRRVGLCKVLLAHPDLLLLDEPTNHLDADAVQWLERHLDEYDGTVIAVTHDRYFLDNVAGWMLEMERGRGTPYQGNYSSYLDQKAKRLADTDRQEAARKRLLARELEWIRKTPSARTSKNKARLKNFERMYDEQEKRQDDTVTITIPAGGKLGQLVLQVEKVTKSFGARTVIKDLTFEIPPGAILGVIGPNGTGKTTLLKLISGQMKPDSGRIRLGPSVTACFVDQERAGLDPTKTVWQEISEGQDELILGAQKMNSRAYVAKFNFKSGDQQQLVGTLSGGQRNRVQLAKMLRRGGNLLLVDEPTNDLDLSTIQVLEDALESFPGCAIVVSHDRFFLDKIATHILAFDHDAKARFWEGNYATYRERLEEEREEAGLGPATKGVHRRLT